jgi:hypothetical protein
MLVANSTEALLDKNPFYMRLKMLANEQKAAYNNLQTVLVAKEKTISDLELQCKTYRCMFWNDDTRVRYVTKTFGVMFLLDVCPTWTRGVALVDLQRRSALRRDKPWDT